VNIEQITQSSKFEVIIVILTLLSVGLALILYLPDIGIESQNAIYIFDLFVVGVLVFDFCVRTKQSGEGSRYILKHWYEIPAMLPLIILARFEDAFVVGAALRSLRLIRLLRLMRFFRIINLFRAAEHWKLSSFVFLLLILSGTVVFGAVAIFEVEQETPKDIRTIKNLEDSLWFAFTTTTISGFGDVYPQTTAGRIVAGILSFIGLAVILGFISNVGTSFVVSKLSKSHKKHMEETKELVKNKINSLEQLQVNDNIDLVEKINNLVEQLTLEKSRAHICIDCKHTNPSGSYYCNRCGNKIGNRDDIKHV
jgi:voltage-gated potassium channel